MTESHTVYPPELEKLAKATSLPHLPLEFRRFLYMIDHPDSDNTTPSLEECPHFYGKINVHHSAISTFYAPSDICGGTGLVRERIRSTPSFHNHSRRDTALVVTDETQKGMLGMTIARVQLFFSFRYRNQDYQCALVNWFIRADDNVDEDTGMWIVEPETDDNEQPTWQVISVDSITRGVHLLPVFGEYPVEQGFQHHQALDYFQSFFVNVYVDHHMHEFLTDY